MTDPLPPSGSRPEAEAPPGTPRWVKVTAIVVGLLILLFLVLQLTGIAGEHGPGMHSSAGQSSTLVTTTG
jgi:cytochrome b561